MFDQIEISQDDGKPQFLYHFQLNDKHWRYTSGMANPNAAQGYVDMDGERWYEQPISHSSVRQVGDTKSETCNVTMPNNLPIPAMFNTTPPSSAILLEIKCYHRGDSQVATVFVGEVVEVNQPTPNRADLGVRQLSASLQRNGLRLHYARLCPHTLYDVNCKAVRTPTAAVLTETGSGLIRATAFASRPDGYFDGGYLQWVDPIRGTERRAIEQHVGNTILLFGTDDGLSVGLAVEAFPGCNKTFATCDLKFNNSLNYGGFPAMPGKSPFDGEPVF